MQGMGSLIDKYKHRTQSAIDDKTICHLFRQLVLAEYGRYGANSVQPTCVRGSSLMVLVSDSVWAGEIWSRRKQLRLSLNKKVGYDYITRIVAHTK